MVTGEYLGNLHYGYVGKAPDFLKLSCWRAEDLPHLFLGRFALYDSGY
nr:hypothetical protein [Paenibacillus dendritiformis]